MREKEIGEVCASFHRKLPCMSNVWRLSDALMLRRDIYEGEIKKYLVLVRDDVEDADEKFQEMTEELECMGLLNQSFSLGDVLDDECGDAVEEGRKQDEKKTKPATWPIVEGEETVQEFVGSYRKAVMSRKALFKGAKDKMDSSQLAPGFETLRCTLSSQHASTAHLCSTT